MPSASEVEENGLDLADMNVKLLQQVEEMMLYIIEQDKRIASLEKKDKQPEKQKRKTKVTRKNPQQ